MSYFFIKPILGGMNAGRFAANNPADKGDHLPDPFDPPAFFGRRSERDAEDREFDSALRSVPLPEGFMARLGNLVVTLTESATDRMDYMGC
jgi:hypothetical protein